MIRRRQTVGFFLALTIVFSYQWLLVRDPLQTSSKAPSSSLAEDSLKAARDSVHEAMRLFLEDHDHDTRAKFGSWRAMDYQRTKFERLQASLDEFLHHDMPDVGGNRTLHIRRSNVPAGNDEDALFDLCAALAGTRTTMVGGDHIYRLHTLLLQHREYAEGQLFPCLGRKFCTHHHICLPPPQLDGAPLKEKSRYVKPPSTQELIETESAIVNYILSDTLWSGPDETSLEYTMPFLDPMTGVRLCQSFWLAAARKANILIIGRGPLSAPGSTYTGNWSFVHFAPDHIDAIDVRNPPETDASRMIPRPLEILNTAVHLTITRFLPEVFQVLQAIRREVGPSKRKRQIWAGTWYRLPGRGTARIALLRPSMIRGTMGPSLNHHRPLPAEQVALTRQLSALLDAYAKNQAEEEDPWTLFYNAQVYLQNMVLKPLLLRHGVLFLSLNIPWSDDSQNWELQSSYGTPADAELERTEFLGKSFMRGLDYVLRSVE